MRITGAKDDGEVVWIVSWYNCMIDTLYLDQ